jgi:hypothetical protein
VVVVSRFPPPTGSDHACGASSHPSAMNNFCLGEDARQRRNKTAGASRRRMRWNKGQLALRQSLGYDADAVLSLRPQ